MRKSSGVGHLPETWKITKIVGTGITEPDPSIKSIYNIVQT